jgi:type II secretory pathway pseudopilin PulG
MPHKPLFPNRVRGGFTIIEIVVILIIIALMLLIIVPHALLERKAGKAQRVKDDLVTLNAAIEHYALDNGKVSGVTLNYSDVRKYLDEKSDIYKLGGEDAFGDTYGPYVVGTRPTVPAKTEETLSTVVGPEFWSPFK